MQKHRTLPIMVFALFTLLLALAGCHRHFTSRSIISPGGGILQYAQAGDVLEWKSWGPDNPDFTVVFTNGSPCGKDFVKIKGGAKSPARCKVLPRHEGFYPYDIIVFDSYENKRPNSSPNLRGIPPGGCAPNCGAYVIRPSNGKLVPDDFSGTPTPSGPDDCNETGPAYALPITCNQGVTKVCSAKRSPGEPVFWSQIGPADPWTVDFMERSPCSNPGPFKPGNDTCKVTGSPGDYTYKVHLQGCAKDGEGTLTVEPPNPNNTTH